MSKRLLVILLTGGFIVSIAAAALIVTRSQRDQPATAGATPVMTPSRGAVTAETPPKPTSTPTPHAATPRLSEASPKPTPVETLGTLIIESDVPETSVFIDRVYLGNAPVTKKDVTPGTHHLNMSVTGYEGVSEDIEVQAGTHTISMKFKDVKLDEKIDVVHKHAMGSCSGTLQASPQRLSYVTTNAGDAFTIPLTNIETFQVDYVQKNLRVKIKDGKTYNFSDADGNADRLYLFHQTVEKVRQRLLAGR